MQRMHRSQKRLQRKLSHKKILKENLFQIFITASDTTSLKMVKYEILMGGFLSVLNLNKSMY